MSETKQEKLTNEKIKSVVEQIDLGEGLTKEIQQEGNVLSISIYRKEDPIARTLVEVTEDKELGTYKFKYSSQNEYELEGGEKRIFTTGETFTEEKAVENVEAVLNNISTFMKQDTLELLKFHKGTCLIYKEDKIDELEMRRRFFPLQIILSVLNNYVKTNLKKMIFSLKNDNIEIFLSTDELPLRKVADVGKDDDLTAIFDGLLEEYVNDDNIYDLAKILDNKIYGKLINEQNPTVRLNNSEFSIRYGRDHRNLIISEVDTTIRVPRSVKEELYQLTGETVAERLECFHTLINRITNSSILIKLWNLNSVKNVGQKVQEYFNEYRDKSSNGKKVFLIDFFKSTNDSKFEECAIKINGTLYLTFREREASPAGGSVLLATLIAADRVKSNPLAYAPINSYEQFEEFLDKLVNYFDIRDEAFKDIEETDTGFAIFNSTEEEMVDFDFTTVAHGVEVSYITKKSPVKFSTLLRWKPEGKIGDEERFGEFAKRFMTKEVQEQLEKVYSDTVSFFTPFEEEQRKSFEEQKVEVIEKLTTNE